MKNSLSILFAAFLGILSNSAYAEKIERTYLDRSRNVHLVTNHNKDRIISHRNNAHNLKLAPDNETVAWMELNAWIAVGDYKPASEILVIFRDGKTFSIKCTPFIRDYWFWQGGRQVAIDCGGRHFAGREILYDTSTLTEVESFDQAEVPLEKRPQWSSGGY